MIARIVRPLLFLAFVVSLSVGTASASVLAESAEEKCVGDGGVWSAGKCLGKTAQDRCQSIGAKWTASPEAKDDEKADDGSCDDSILDDKR